MFYLLHCSSAIVPVGQDEDGFGPQALDLCLRRQKWEQALGILDEMVKRGEAVNGAVDGAQADPPEIRRSHPELVILLRGQRYIDMKKRGGDLDAQTYYHDFITAIYPQNASTGSSFADKLLARLGSPDPDAPVRYSTVLISNPEIH
jgi:pentatricopeptide repeat protein